jgi:hypothetical protein
MHRYYMTAQTRQAVIAESNRLIAARAATNSFRRRPESDGAGEPLESDLVGSQGDTQASVFDVESAFARLVQDLQETSVRFRSS